MGMRFAMLGTRVLAAGAVVFWASLGLAQTTEVNFGNPSDNSDLPIEVSAESLAIDQDTGVAEYRGDVVISQGEMRLAAASVLIVYDEDAGEIDRMEATGGVTLVSQPDAAEAQNAVYMVRESKLRLTGSVLLTQGINALASDEMVVDLENGTAQILGRVRTVLNPSRQD